MNKFPDSGILVSLAGIILLSGCATTASVHEYLLQSPNPTPFTAPHGPLQPSDAAKLYDEYRGYVNEQGIQIGHRHFNIERLPDYFRESHLDLLGQRANKAYWADLAQKNREDELEAGRIIGNGGGSLESLLAFIAIFVTVEIVDAVKDEKYSKILGKAGGSTETIENVMDSYNRILVAALGISRTPQTLAKIKELPKSMPDSVSLGPNSTMEDWLEDYNFRQEGPGWWFGYQRSDPREMLSLFDPDDANSTFKIMHNKLTYFGGALDTLAILGICFGLSALASPYDHPAQDNITFDDGKWLAAGGAILGSIGITCHWQAWSQKNQIKDRFNLKMKMGLFPSSGVK